MSKKREIAIVRDYHLAAERNKADFMKREAANAKACKEQLEFMDSTFFLLAEAMHELDKLRLKDGAAMFYFCAAGMKTHRAVRHLIAGGTDQDAMTLVRALLEIVLQAKYLTQDIHKHNEQFWAYADIAKCKRAEKRMLFEKSWRPDGGDKELDRLRAARKAFVGKYGDDRNWFLGTVESLAKKVGMEKAYVDTYVAHSNVAHGSPLAAKMYTAGDRFDIYPSSKQAAWMTVMSSFYMLQLAETYADACGARSGSISDIFTEIAANLSNLARKKQGLGSLDLVLPMPLSSWGVLRPQHLKGLRPSK